MVYYTIGIIKMFNLYIRDILIVKSDFSMNALCFSFVDYGACSMVQEQGNITNPFFRALYN